MPIGVPASRTNDFNVTRNRLIEMAFAKIGVLEDGEPLRSSLLQNGVDTLNLFVRELADRELYLHGQVTSALTLVAQQWAYTNDNGDLPTNIDNLVKVVYRDASGSDHPVEIINRAGWESLPNKLSTGDPEKVFLTDETDYSLRTLYVWPARSSVNSQSVVTGTNGTVYKCIRSHTASSSDTPITGANYLLYWEAGGSSPSTWTSGTSYTAPQQLRLTYERLLYDFDTPTDNPDIPSSQSRFMLYALSADLAPDFHVSVDRIAQLQLTANEAFERTFPRAVRKTTTDYHNKAVYF